MYNHGARIFSNEGPRPRIKTTVAVLVVAAVVALSFFVLIERGRLDGLGRYGYLGAFVLGFVGSTVVAVPFPWLLILAPLGLVYPHLWLTLAAVLGTLLGSYLPYLLGQRIVEQTRFRVLAERVERMPGWKKVLVVMALAASPVASYPGLAAGVLRYPWIWAMLITFVAEAAKVMLALTVTNSLLRLFT